MSDAIRIELPEDPPAYEPRQELVGTLSWKRTKPFSEIQLSLIWYTSGIGDEDSSVVETLEWKDLGEEGDRFFEIRLPRAPYTLESENLRIHWVLEAVGKPGKDRAAIELTIAPGAKPVKLTSVENSSGAMLKLGKWLGIGTKAE